MSRKPNSYMRNYADPQRKKPRNNDNFTTVSIIMPTHLYRRALAIHARRKPLVSFGRMLCYAIYNELETANPFEFDLTLPAGDCEGLQAHERNLRIFDFFKKHEYGTGLDTLVLNCDALQMTKDQAILGANDLLKQELFEEVKPPPSQAKHDPKTRYLKIKKYDPFEKTSFKQEKRAVEKRTNEMLSGQKPLISIHTPTQRGPLDDIDSDDEPEEV